MTEAAFWFFADPWENSELPTIVRDCAHGGDPHILATIKRVHDPAALHDLCRLATEQLTRHPKPTKEAVERVTEAEWQKLLDKDDRTSPEEYPDMCLITRDEIVSIIEGALSSGLFPVQALTPTGSGERIKAMRAALQKAEQFIVNGVEFGFIRMPETASDPAHETLPAIRAALEGKMA